MTNQQKNILEKAAVDTIFDYISINKLLKLVAEIDTQEELKLNKILKYTKENNINVYDKLRTKKIIKTDYHYLTNYFGYEPIDEFHIISIASYIRKMIKQL